MFQAGQGFKVWPLRRSVALLAPPGHSDVMELGPRRLRSGGEETISISRWVVELISSKISLERTLLFNKTLVQILGCLYLPNIGCFHHIQLEDLAPNRFFFDWFLFIITTHFFLVVQGDSESVPGPAEASGEAKAGFFSTWETWKSWDLTLLFWITWCFDLIVGLGQNIGKKIVTNSQFVYLCAVLIPWDVPSMVACALSRLPF